MNFTAHLAYRSLFKNNHAIESSQPQIFLFKTKLQIDGMEKQGYVWLFQLLYEFKIFQA